MRVQAFLSWLFLIFGLYAVLLISTLCIRSRRENERRRKSEQAKAMRAQQAEDRKREREAAKAAENAPAPKRKRGRPRKQADPAADPAAELPKPGQIEQDTAISATPMGDASTLDARLAKLGIKGNNAFAGQHIAFTGELEGMTRAQAIQLVQENGGKGYEGMPACTTMLVIADKLTRSGKTTGKLEKADRWIGHVRKISEGTFKVLLNAPLKLTPDQFAAMVDM